MQILSTVSTDNLVSAEGSEYHSSETSAGKEGIMEGIKGTGVVTLLRVQGMGCGGYGK